MTTQPLPLRLDHEDDVFVLDLGDGENRFNPDSIAAIHAALDQVEAADGPRALVTTATGKFFSNGLDLEWLGANSDRVQETVDGLHRLLARVLGLGVPTVAAVQGHAFAAGAMFAVAHDHAVMRADRGYWCVPEADLGMPFTEGMNALLIARLPTRTTHTAMLTGRRYAGPDAVRAGIVDTVADADAVVSDAKAFAATQTSKDPDVLAKIKRRLHGDAIEALERSEPLA